MRIIIITFLFWGTTLFAQDITNNLIKNGSFKVKSASSKSLLTIVESGNTTINGQLTFTNGSSGYTIPNTDGSANQVLTTNGNGTVSWAEPISSVPIRFIICFNGYYPFSDREITDGFFIGEVVMFAGSSDNIPPNFMECKGQSLSITDYLYLNSIFGNKYGGDGRTYFNLPNFSNSVPKCE